jgi:hypothetical protein
VILNELEEHFGEKIMFTSSNKGDPNPKKDEVDLVIAAKYDILQGYGHMWDGAKEQREAQSILQTEEETMQKLVKKITAPTSLFK